MDRYAHRSCHASPLLDRESWLPWLRRATGAAILGLGVGAASHAHAAACVTVDEERDGLSPEERTSARTLFEDALGEHQVQVAREGCTETWTLYHVRIGETVTVTVRAPRGTRRERIKTLDDLPAVYSQLIRAIQTGGENTNDRADLDRRDVTVNQSEARRVRPDAVWYAKLGYGATPVDGVTGGPAFGFGRRWELDRFAIDLSFLNFILYQDSDEIAGTSVGWIELGGDYFFAPYANHTLYLGAGLSFSSHAIPGDGDGGGVGSSPDQGSYMYDVDSHYEGAGLQGKLTVGFEMFRASTIRMLINADAALPMYRVKHTSYLSLGGTETELVDRVYAPTLTLSLGLGWGGRGR